MDGDEFYIAKNGIVSLMKISNRISDIYIRKSSQKKGWNIFVNIKYEIDKDFWDPKNHDFTFIDKISMIESLWSGYDAFPCDNIYQYTEKSNTLKSLINSFIPEINVHLDEFDIYEYELKEEQKIDKRFSMLDEKYRNKADILKWRLNSFLDKCDNSFDRVIIGKIINKTSLSRKEVERYDDFKDLFKEQYKIQSFLRKNTTLIEI